MIAFIWNMQGAKSGGENRWSSDVASFFVNKADLVLLQECGAAPASAKLQPIDAKQWAPGIKIPANVVYRYGTVGTERTARYLLHAAWDEGGNRCNLAIMSTAKQVSFVTLDNPLNAGKRPLLGSVIDGRLYATIHAFSGSGNDGPKFVDAMGDLAKLAGASSWFLGGDFNRDPQKYIDALGKHVWASGSATNRGSGNELDYGIASFEWGQRRPEAQAAPYSDHLPVRFDLP